MTYAEFQSAVAQKRCPPVVLLYGEEDFLIDELVQGIIRNLLEEGMKGFNLDVVSGGRADVREVIAYASAFPMMSERRVVVVKEFEKLATTEPDKEAISSYVKNPLASTCLVAVSLDPDLRKKPFTDLKKHAEVVECKPLYDNQVPAWVGQRIVQQGKKSDPEACRMLQAYVGNSLRALQNEIDKLFTFVGSKPAITVDDVTQVVGASKGYTIFELQNAVGRRDLKESLRILQAMLQAGQSPQLIIVMLTRFLQQLWKISELRLRRASETEMSREIGVHPFFVKQVVQCQANFTNDHLERGFRVLLEADATLKSTSRDPRVVMDVLVYALVRGTPEPERVLAKYD